jgi:hypothetical protein
MATPPTMLNKYESANWLAANPATMTLMSAVSIQSGDIIVVVAATQDKLSGSLSITENGSATPTAQYLNVGNAYIALWTYVCTGNETLTLSIGLSSTMQYFGGVAYHFRGSDGIGAKNQTAGTSGDPAVTLTSVAANSAIVMIVSDWNATAGTQTANTTIGSFTPATGHPGDGYSYGAFAGYYADVGVAGNKAIGMTVPDGQDWTIAGIEVKGAAGGAPTSILRQMMQYH